MASAAGFTALGLAGAPAVAVDAPVTFNLDAAPADLVPATVSTLAPVRVVSTVRDRTGRPVVTSRPATDRAAAEALVADAQRTPGAVGVELDTPVSALGSSDTYRNLQWDFAKLEISGAWARSTGEGVIVAVLDTGVAASHPDQAGQGLAGTDLVDGGDGRTDGNGHGTHVAGTIAAVAGNDTGVAGIAVGAKILPVRVLDEKGSGWSSDVADGIVWAADHGAKVINMSLGSPAGNNAVTQAVAYARGRGATVVAAAGNSRAAGSPVNYPGADPGVIAVASTDADEDWSSFSNRGSYVDIAAPGGSILSTVPTAKGSYSYMSGTSMAAPHVAALAALLKAARPAMTPDQIEQTMKTTALDLGTPGRDDDYGYGRIRPVNALVAVLASTPVSPSATSTPTSAPSSTPSSKPTATPTATPSKSPSKAVLVAPVVTTAASSRTVAHGTDLTTTFVVTAGGTLWAGRPVALCTANNSGGGTFACTATTTSASGTVKHTRTADRTFRVQLKIAATTTNKAAESRVLTYTVKAAAGLRKAGAKALTATVAGAVGPQVTVERQERGRWTPVSTYAAVATKTISNLKTGYPYRVSVAACPAATAATSTTVKL